jgi:hypothetical protein
LAARHRIFDPIPAIKGQGLRSARFGARVDLLVETLVVAPTRNHGGSTTAVIVAPRAVYWGKAGNSGSRRVSRRTMPPGTRGRCSRPVQPVVRLLLSRQYRPAAILRALRPRRSPGAGPTATSSRCAEFRKLGSS